MPRKFDMNEMKAKLAKYDERKTETEKALSKIEASRKELVAKIANEERKIRTHNLCEVGGLVYKYFGENLTGEQFKEILDVLFKMNGVQEFVNAEKDKRALAEIERIENITLSELFTNSSLTALKVTLRRLIRQLKFLPTALKFMEHF